MGLFERVLSNIQTVEEYHSLEESKKPFHLGISETMPIEKIEEIEDPLHREMTIMNTLTGLSRSKILLNEAISLKHAAILDYSHKKDDFKDMFSMANKKIKESNPNHVKMMASLSKHLRNIESGVKPLLSQEKIDLIDSLPNNSQIGQMKLMVEILKVQEQCLAKLSNQVTKNKHEVYEKIKSEMKLVGLMEENEWDVEAAIKRITNKE